MSDRIALAIRGGSEGDVRALTGFSETIAGETLAKSITIEFTGDPATDAALELARWIAALDGRGGQYSNQGVLVIDVWKSEAIDV